MLAGIVDVAQHCGAPHLAGVVYNDVAKTNQALPKRGGDRNVLDLAERNVARSPRNQAVIDLQFGVGHRVANYIALQMVVSRDQKQPQPDWQRYPPRYVDEANH